MQLFTTEAIEPADLPDDMPELPAAALAAIASNGVPDGTPFVLRTDGRYDRLLNRFLRRLPSIGVGAENSRRCYAQQIVLAARYIEDRCKRPSILDGTLDDFESYREVRRGGRKPEVTARTWNQQVAALEKLFQSAVHQGLLEKTPFLYASSRICINGRFEQRDVNALYDTAPAEDVVRCLSIEEYEFFRDVGLGGLAPGDSGRRIAATGRTSVRDQALAELLVTTGMRITECLVLLREELPLAEAGERVLASAVDLAREITKGGKAREIWVSHRVLRDHVDDYIVTDRADAVARARSAGRYDALTRPVIVDAVDDGTARVRDGGGSGTLTLAKLKPIERRRLYRHENGTVVGPVVIWCREDGQPLSDAAVRMNFKRACERCNRDQASLRRFGRPMHVTPHTLRHTFAVAHLNQLIREAGLSIRRGSAGPDANDFERLRRVLMDPLDQLRRRLGHRSVETTYRYLTYLEKARGAAYKAVLAWDERLTRDAIETEQHRGRH